MCLKCEVLVPMCEAGGCAEKASTEAGGTRADDPRIARV